MSDKQTPFFAASSGGHLDLLETIAPRVLEGREPVWITARLPRGKALRAAASEVVLVPEFGRNPLKLLFNIAIAALTVLRRRPGLVVTSGAGVIVPFCVLARLAGARLVYIETMARVSSPSMTARLLSRIAARVIVQWPELEGELPGAVTVRPTLLESIGAGSPASGEGTFVAVGTDRREYRRLLDVVEQAIEDGVLPGPVRAQVGPTTWEGPGVTARAYMTTEELDAEVRSAQLVVCHGGAGIISSALSAGRTPIVVPRRAALGEHIDDHQYQLTRKLADWDLVVQVEEEITPCHVERAKRRPAPPGELDEHPSAVEVLKEDLAA